jgi:hypothetical protein
MFEVKKILPHVYWLGFDNATELGLSFLRYQEFYESPNGQFRGQKFLVEDYKRWYIAETEESWFTYCEDWAGFNVPSVCFQQVQELGISDYNNYDGLILGIVNYIKMLEEGAEFYVIGSLQNSKEIMRHEVAHGLFATNLEYKNKSLKLINDLDPEIYKFIKKELIRMGYTEAVFEDETQAYLSTGAYALIEFEEIFDLDAAQIPFIELFLEYTKDLGIW